MRSPKLRCPRSMFVEVSVRLTFVPLGVRLDRRDAFHPRSSPPRELPPRVAELDRREPHPRGAGFLRGRGRVRSFGRRLRSSRGDDRASGAHPRPARDRVRAQVTVGFLGRVFMRWCFHRKHVDVYCHDARLTTQLRLRYVTARSRVADVGHKRMQRAEAEISQALKLAGVAASRHSRYTPETRRRVQQGHLRHLLRKEARRPPRLDRPCSSPSCEPPHTQAAVRTRAVLVGTGGFEPPASASQTRRSNQAELRPVAASLAL
jgi:hypothetical protein